MFSDYLEQADPGFKITIGNSRILAGRMIDYETKWKVIDLVVFVKVEKSVWSPGESQWVKEWEWQRDFLITVVECPFTQMNICFYVYYIQPAYEYLVSVPNFQELADLSSKHSLIPISF